MRDRSLTPVVLGRLALMALAAAAAATSFPVWRGSGKPAPAADGARAAYVCPMHPNVTSTSPGDCPICRMALVPKAGAEPPATAESKGAAARRDGPPTLTLPAGKELHGWDA